MTTAANIITRSAQTLGYLGRTEVLSAADANDGLTAFNNMLDSWSTETLLSYVILQTNFTLSIGVQTYTVGSGGVINITRPLDIFAAFVRDFNNLDYPMTVVPRDIWDGIGDKTITSQIPDTLYYSSQFPLGVINIFPVPLMPYKVYFNTITQQIDASGLTATISMPVGYEQAYVYNLALQMMNNGFPCLLNDRDYAQLVENARQSKGNIKRMNIKEVIASYDAAIVARSQATYNIYSDNSPRG